ncbi:MAG: putative porin [Elusimicrobia bacterium]|nr:putative porin [Candidatus Liberimonas magnetica]
MKMKAILAAIVMMSTGIAYAGEADMLINKLAEKGIISYGEAQQILTEGKEEARKDLAKGKIATLPAWIQNLSLKGDLRLRHQLDWDSSKTYPRIRERARLRMGFESRMAENMQAGFGLATGGETLSGATVSGTTASGGSIIDSEPTSTNHTFTNGFAKSMLMVDYMYLKYNPFSFLSINAGKMKSGDHVWNPTDLLWDTDINPDGVAVKYSKDITEKLNIDVVGSWLVFCEKNAVADNPIAYIAQPIVKYTVNDNISIKAAAALQSLQVKGKSTVYYDTNPAFDYNGTNFSFEAKYLNIIGSNMLCVYGDTITNGDSKPTTDKDGSAIGVKFGADKISEFGQWQVAYMARELKANAWLNKLGDSDAYGGANNSKGFEAVFTMGLTKACSLGIDYYAMDKINSATATTPKSLVQADVVYKF